jgi:hypothetical protein
MQLQIRIFQAFYFKNPILMSVEQKHSFVAVIPLIGDLLHFNTYWNISVIQYEYMYRVCVYIYIYILTA